MSKLYCVLVRDVREYHVHIEARNEEEIRNLDTNRLQEACRHMGDPYEERTEIIEVDIPSHWEDVKRWGVHHSTITRKPVISGELDME